MKKNSAASSEKTAKRRGGKPFQKGQSGNPSGRPKLPEEINEIRKVSREELIKSYATVALLTPESFFGYEPKNMLEAGIKKSFSQFAENGDTSSIKTIWEFVIGKPSITIPEGGSVKLVFGTEEADL